MLKIFDCSNSAERPQSGQTGPVENTLVAAIKKYAPEFDCRFVYNVNSADVLFTNDVFPANLANIKKPRVKRMDGIYWQENLQSRNQPYNWAALEADAVIFISQFSYNSYIMQVNERIKRPYIILNNVDTEIFNRFGEYYEYKINRWAASASDWSRPEKRLSSIIDFARKIQEPIYLIGKCEEPLPSNIIKFGYIKDQKYLRKILISCDAFINTSYRDAAPKTVCEAVACGLPVLYLDSGGVRELVKVGIGCWDKIHEYFHQKGTPQQSISTIAIEKFYAAYPNMVDAARLNPSTSIRKTVKQYCNVFKDVYNDRT
jgi:glycosyltransferase involved in cell wall biosynthesis